MVIGEIKLIYGRIKMSKKFILCVEYGTGKAGMITSSPDLVEALKEFTEANNKALSDSKIWGIPNIKKAELIPLLYNKEFENG